MKNGVVKIEIKKIEKQKRIKIQCDEEIGNGVVKRKIKKKKNKKEIR